MDGVVELFRTAFDQLLGRASGPMHLRLILQPLVAIVLAIRAGLRDARDGRPAFFWTVLTDKAERRILIHSGWKDVGKVFVIALVLDAVYQILVLHSFFPLQWLIVGFTVAVVPYVLLRGPVTRIARAVKRTARPATLTPATKH